MIIGIDASRANQEQKTGVGWYAFHLIQEMKKITPDDIRVVLYTDKPLRGALAELPENWEEKVLFWPVKKLWTQLRMSLEMLVYPPDILFIPAHVFPLCRPKKTIMTVHDIAALKFPSCYSRFERWYTIWSAKTALKKLYKIIVPTEFVRQELIKTFGSRHEHKIAVIRHGCYADLYQHFDESNVKPILHKYAVDKPYAIAIGRLEEKKNTIGIISAFNCLRPEISGLKLLLAGMPGQGYERVKVEIDKSDYSEDIICPGWVNEHDLPALLSQAEVLVFPSWYEGFGMPVLEALAAGVPVVASRGTSLEEVGGEAGWYVDPSDSRCIAEGMELLLTDSRLREEKILAGLERVKKFSWEKSARETFTLLLN